MDGVPDTPFIDQRVALLSERYLEGLAQGNYFYQQVIEELDGARVTVAGQPMLMMSSYSYLGLLGHPTINRAAQEALATFGTGTHGVRLLAGTNSLHVELERAIAQFNGTESAVAFSSGYVTNIAVISAFASRGHVVICDRLDHASIFDGCVLSGAKLMVYRHNDMGALKRRLEQAGNAGKLVVVDAVFSMDGDIVNLPEVVQLCRHYGAALMVDEAHSLGVLGSIRTRD